MRWSSSRVSICSLGPTVNTVAEDHRPARVGGTLADVSYLNFFVLPSFFEGQAMTDVPHYSMIIRWDSRSDIFVVSVPELPGCMTHGKTYAEAVKQGEDAIESWIMAALANEEVLPPPQQFTDVA